MSIKRRTQKLSKITRDLLAEGESARADFKRSPDGISVDDLVSFANSRSGGSILAGVDERIANGVQTGVVRGCDASDASILQVLNKAVSCIPPVSINIYVENIAQNPILRVEIESSQTKPHCTPRGIYCIRDGARNRPLHPAELLRIFLDNEASEFAMRFESAAVRISNELNDLEQSISKSISSMADQFGWAEYQLDETGDKLDSIQGIAAKAYLESEKANSRLKAIIEQDKREDPVKSKEKLQLFREIVRSIDNDPKLLRSVIAGKKMQLTVKKDAESDVIREDIDEIVEAALRYVHNRERDKNYEISVKAPIECSDTEIEQFALKVAEGGEVGGGVIERARQAFRLGFIYYGNSVVGTAALKRPAAGYRAKVFRKAGSELSPKDYPYELGWIFLDVPHRRKGQMTRLIEGLLPIAQDSGLFATTRTSNNIMRDVLTQLNFSQEGVEYKSEMDPQQWIELFVRAAPKLAGSA